MEIINLAVIENGNYKKAIIVENKYLGLSINDALKVIEEIKLHNNNERIKEENIFKNAINIYSKK